MSIVLITKLKFGDLHYIPIPPATQFDWELDVASNMLDPVVVPKDVSLAPLEVLLLIKCVQNRPFDRTCPLNEQPDDSSDTDE